MRKLKTKSENEFIDEIIQNYNLVDRRDRIYSIDPLSSKDFDDAFSFKVKNDMAYYQYILQMLLFG